MVKITRNTKRIAILMSAVMIFTPIMSGQLRKANNDKKIRTVVSDLDLGPKEEDITFKNKVKTLKKIK